MGEKPDRWETLQLSMGQFFLTTFRSLVTIGLGEIILEKMRCESFVIPQIKSQTLPLPLLGDKLIG